MSLVTRPAHRERAYIQCISKEKKISEPINFHYLISINFLKAGINLQTVEVTPDPVAPKYTPVTKLDTVSSAYTEKQGVVIECIRPAARKGKLLAKTKSKKFNSQYPSISVQL